MCNTVLFYQMRYDLLKLCCNTINSSQHQISTNRCKYHHFVQVYIMCKIKCLDCLNNYRCNISPNTVLYVVVSLTRNLKYKMSYLLTDISVLSSTIRVWSSAEAISLYCSVAIIPLIISVNSKA